MPAPLAAARDRLRHYRLLAMETYWTARRRRPGFDHLVRAYERYSDRGGDQLAGSVTYFGFLSFFPLLALAFAVLGYVSAGDVEARAYLAQAIDDILPGLSERLPIARIEQARTGAGAIGLLGLAYAGLGAVAALRTALHSIWLKSPSEEPGFLLAKLTDLVVMVVLGTLLVGSVALTSVAQAATRWLLAGVELQDSPVALVVTRVLALVIAVGVNLLIFLIVFSKLSGTRRPWRVLWRGALLAAVGFEALKAAGTLLVGGTLDNPVYASFAVLVGLLVWINIVTRLVLLCAAWTATWLPVPPPYEGTAPVGVPVGLTSTEPARAAVRRESSVHYGAFLPARPTGERLARSTVRARRRAVLAALRRVAVPLASVACVIGLAAWLRRRRGARSAQE